MAGACACVCSLGRLLLQTSGMMMAGAGEGVCVSSPGRRTSRLSHLVPRPYWHGIDALCSYSHLGRCVAVTQHPTAGCYCRMLLLLLTRRCRHVWLDLDPCPDPMDPAAQADLQLVQHPHAAFPAPAHVVLGLAGRARPLTAGRRTWTSRPFPSRPRTWAVAAGCPPPPAACVWPQTIEYSLRASIVETEAGHPGFRVWGAGWAPRVQGLGYRARTQGSGCGVYGGAGGHQGSGCRVGTQGSGLRVEGEGPGRRVSEGPGRRVGEGPGRRVGALPGFRARGCRRPRAKVATAGVSGRRAPRTSGLPSPLG